MDWVVTDDLARESWRRLLEFANLDLTIDTIRRIHGEPTDSSVTRNYRKQAEQARVCVLQAKEYFDAARDSTLITAPNHLYYGMVALASMQMLVLGDGTRSLDYLRKDPKNAHHGLLFSTGCSASAASKGLSLLELSWAEIQPRGHFLNWYSVLPRRVDIFGLYTFTFKEGSFQDFRSCGGYDIATASSIVGRKRAAIELMVLFPDLFRDLRRYGVAQAAVRLTQEVRVQADSAVRHLWTIHQVLNPESFQRFLDRFQIPARFADVMTPRLGANGSPLAVEVRIPDVPDFEFRWPEARYTMDHQLIAFGDPIDTHELVDGYLVAYQLSMLSRYFPDLWVACIESHGKAAKLIEQTVDLLIKKSPILALSLLSAEELMISTHREPWK